MNGLFLATGDSQVGEKATEFVRNFCRRAFALELTRAETPKDEPKFLPEMTGRAKRQLHLTTALEECFVGTLSSSTLDQRPILQKLLAHIINDFRALTTSGDAGGRSEQSRNVDKMLFQIAQRFASLCHEEDWTRKMSGVAAIEVFVNRVDLSRELLIQLEIEYVRALLYCLRDAPKDPPSSADQVLELMKSIIKTCQGGEDGKSRVPRLTETLVVELNSQSDLSRKAAQVCLEVLAEATGQQTPELIEPAAKAKLLDLNAGPIYSKPLRALPFPMQVGNIDAMTYLLELKPTFIETSEEFVRLLHEVLALADVDDSNLISKPATHKQENWLKTLRISCLRLLKSTMVQFEFLNKPNLSSIRSR
jgi:transformation/transcription domain-associated protein